MGDVSKLAWIESARKMQAKVQARIGFRKTSLSDWTQRAKLDELDAFAFNAADMNEGTTKPPRARFEKLFVGDQEWTEDRVRETLARIGIDTMFLVADCDPRGSLRALSRRDAECVAQDMRHKARGWKLACVWEDEGDIILRYVRPMSPTREQETAHG